MKAQSRLIIFSFRDMIDWHSLKINKFRKRSIAFNLEHCLDEVMEMMFFKAKIVDLNIIFEPIFKA